MICACGTELPGRRRVCDTCRAQSPSQVANRKGKRLDGTLRPSRERHNKGLRVDGTKRPSRQRHEAKNNGTRDRRRGEHTKLSRLERPFWMIDGEGAGEGSDHEYLLLASGDRAIRAPDIPTSARDGAQGVGGNMVTGLPAQTPAGCEYLPGALIALDFSTCLSFLAACIPNDVEPFFFGGDYDVTMWLKSLPREKLVELMDREGRTDPKQPYRPRPVRAQGFEIDWLPGHFFWFRSPSGRTFRISDVRRFFGGSFIAALASQGIETPPWAVEMKRRRRHFTREEVLGPEVARYNAWERASGQEMMTRFREHCIAVGVVPAHWEGPGQGATAIMADMGIKDHLSGGFER